jgi:trk system potassium uptake protein TrkA
MFDQSWGVDVAVSTPRMLSALVEEAVSVGDLVRLFTFRQGEANLVEITLSVDSPVVGNRVGDQNWPPDTALVAIVRGPHVITPSPDDPLEVGDELLFVAVPDQEPTLQRLLGHA